MVPPRVVDVFCALIMGLTPTLVYTEALSRVPSAAPPTVLEPTTLSAALPNSDLRLKWRAITTSVRNFKLHELRRYVPCAPHLARTAREQSIVPDSASFVKIDT